MNDTYSEAEIYSITIRLARRAAALASEYARQRGLITDPMQGAVMLYSDDPCAVAHMYCESSLAEICNVSHIESIACVMGDKFPPASFEAERQNPEHPRIAALWFYATGSKCPRCRKYIAATDELCARCSR